MRDRVINFLSGKARKHLSNLVCNRVQCLHAADEKAPFVNRTHLKYCAIAVGYPMSCTLWISYINTVWCTSNHFTYAHFVFSPLLGILMRNYWNMVARWLSCHVSGSVVTGSNPGIPRDWRVINLRKLFAHTLILSSCERSSRVHIKFRRPFHSSAFSKLNYLPRVQQL
jgi:hypothetical protein